MRGKRPTRKQKELIAAHKLDYNNWLIKAAGEKILIITHKKTGSTRTIKIEG